MEMDELYPLKLEGALKEVIWGGQALGERLGKPLPPGASIGETWEFHDSARVVNGPLAGQTLGEVYAQMGATLIGSAMHTSNIPEILPLLIKFIDANQTLSVQVHPDDDYARAHEQAQAYNNGKTEAWYIIGAAPDGVVYLGWNRDTSREEVAAAIEAGALESLLVRVPVSEGDVIFVPAGTVHAIGAGVLLYEVQENSDITYRLYDWNRTDAKGQPRELHLAQSLEVLDYRAGKRPNARGLPIELPAGQRQLLVACGYFLLDRLTLRAPHTETLRGDSCHILSCLDGTATVTLDEGAPITVGRGETVLLPAAGSAYRIAPEGEVTLLRSFIPNPALDVLEPLRDAGYDEQAITQVACF